MTKLISEGADVAIGSCVPIEITVDIDLTTGAYLISEIEIVFIKPSGQTIIRTPASLLNYVITYNTFSSDLDEEGEWHVYVRNLKVGYEFVKGNSVFTVRPKAEDMAVANG